MAIDIQRVFAMGYYYSIKFIKMFFFPRSLASILLQSAPSHLFTLSGTRMLLFRFGVFKTTPQRLQRVSTHYNFL